MKPRALAGALAIVVLMASREGRAEARRIVVGGHVGDAISTRIEEELVAMGFETVRMEASEGCTRAGVERQIREAGARAATCASSDAIGIWTLEASGARLRDVVVPRATDEHERDMAAVRAAEIARASLALAPEPAGPAPATSAQAPIAAPKAESIGPARDAPPAPSREESWRVPHVAGSAGVSSLMGVDATVAAFSGELEIGVARWLAIAPRIELPLESRQLDFQNLGVRPGFAGISAVLPVTRPSAFVIPRFGAGIGAAWLVASTADASSTQFGGNGVATQVPTSKAASDSTWSPAAYASAGLSMRIVGPLRFVVDGVFGATMSRLVARTQGVDRAYWGAPFGALALRLELMVR